MPIWNNLLWYSVCCNIVQNPLFSSDLVTVKRNMTTSAETPKTKQGRPNILAKASDFVQPSVSSDRVTCHVFWISADDTSVDATTDVLLSRLSFLLTELMKVKNGTCCKAMYIQRPKGQCSRC